MVILVLNCGSSSIKYQVIEMQNDGDTLLAKGLIERIGIENGVLTHKPVGKEQYKITTDIPDHTVGIDLIIKAITNPEHGVIASLEELDAVGHRVVHGGEKFKQSALIDKDVIDMVEGCVDLAPLHIPANLKGIYAINTHAKGLQYTFHHRQKGFTVGIFYICGINRQKLIIFKHCHG